MMVDRRPPRVIAFLVATSFDVDPRARKVAMTLADAGFGVSVFAWDRDGRGRSSETLGRITIRRVGPQTSIGTGLRQLPALLAFWVKAIAFLAQSRLAAIHCNRFDTLPPALLVGWLRRIPIVYDLHMSYADRLGIHTAQIGMRLVRRCVRWLESLALRKLVAHAFTDSQPYTESLEQRGVSVASTILNVPSRRFGEGSGDTRPSASETQITIGRIGAMSEQLGQGVEDLLAISRRLTFDARQLDVRLILVGNFVPADYGKRIRDLVADVPYEIIIADYVPHEQVPLWYRKMDFSVITYEVAGRARYGRLSTSQKVFEALACGVPIVYLGNAYMEELVMRLGAGLVPDRRDQEGIYECVLQLVRNRSLRTRMAEAGRTGFLEGWYWEAQEEIIRTTYHAVLLRYSETRKPWHGWREGVARRGAGGTTGRQRER